MKGQQSLSTFFESVSFSNPALAEQIKPDVMTVAMYGLAGDKTPAKEAADRLRRAAFDMPVLFARVLDMALEDLGF